MITESCFPEYVENESWPASIPLGTMVSNSRYEQSSSQHTTTPVAMVTSRFFRLIKPVDSIYRGSTSSHQNRTILYTQLLSARQRIVDPRYSKSEEAYFARIVIASLRAYCRVKWGKSREKKGSAHTGMNLEMQIAFDMDDIGRVEVERGG